MKTAGLAGLTLALAVSTAAAQETPPPYLDNRTDAPSLVSSYYNAISRREYARAWSYFGDRKPSANLEAFAKGFETTQSVTVLTGAVSEEGAAGTIYYSVPVAIAARATDGAETVFAGCYTARLSNPQAQGDDFRPLALEAGEMRASDKSIEESLPPSCGDAPPPPARDKPLEDARAKFIASHRDHCSAITPDGRTDAPEQHDIAYRYRSSGEDEPENRARLFRFYCGSGAYNESHIYYLFKETEGVRELQFASPELDIRYEVPDSDEKVESVGIIGYTVEAELVNSFYDPASMTITSAPKWRGIGDASSTGLWLFRDGAFTLVKYDVDASYNGEIDPETVLDFDTAP